MGSRGNYVIVQGGRAEAYYAQWGGSQVSEALVAGPQATIAIIRSYEAVDSIMERAWAEGGIAIDLDRNELRFFSRPMTPAHLRRMLLPAIRAIWSDWDVAWAERGIVDIASYYGWEVDRVLDAEDNVGDLMPRPAPTIPDDRLLAEDRPDWQHSVLTVRWSAEVVSDYRASVPAPEALSLGPRLLDLLAGAPLFQLGREAESRLPHPGAFMDPVARVIQIAESGTADPRVAPAIAKRWPNCRAYSHTQGLARQVALSGRDPTPVMVSDERAVDAFLDALPSDGPTCQQAIATFATLERSLDLHQGRSSGERLSMLGATTFADTDLPAVRARLHAPLLRLMADADGQREAWGTDRGV